MHFANLSHHLQKILIAKKINFKKKAVYLKEQSLENLVSQIKDKTKKKINISSTNNQKKWNKKTFKKNQRLYSFEKAVYGLQCHQKKSRWMSFYFLQKKIFIVIMVISFGIFISWISPKNEELSEIKKWIKTTFDQFLAGKKIPSLPINFSQKQNNYFTGITHILSVNTYVPIISTPELVSSNQLFFANRMGYVFAMNPNSGKLIARYSLGDINSKEIRDIVSSPLVLELRNNEKAILYLHSDGGFTAVDEKAQYLYQAERGIFRGEKIYSSPVSFTTKKKAGFVIATMKGSVATFSAERGTLLWQTNIKEKSFFATPLVDKKELLLVGTQGSLYKIDLETGKFIWERNSSLEKSVKASPIALKTRQGKKRYLVLSSSGKIGIYNAKGQEIFIQSINEPIIASPVRLKEDTAIVGTLAGNVYKVSVHDDAKNKGKIKLLWKKEHASFVSTPVILPFSDAQENDFSVLLVDRNGFLFIIDNTGKEQAKKSLNYHVSATPLVADLNDDAKLETIIASEDGHIEIFRLVTKNSHEFFRSRIVSSGFLHFQK